MDNSNADREEEQPITGDMIDNIGKEVDIHIMQKKGEKKTQEIKTVLKYITACLNTDGGVVTLKNNDWKGATGKHLDDWYGIVEQYLFDESSKFIKFEGTYQDRILRLRITPLHYLFSVDMHLYFPRNTDIVEVKYKQAIEILKTNDKSGSLSELPATEEYFEHKQKMSKLSENDRIQFKEIRSDNIPSKFSSTINKYISAFCNHKGGRILFGIEDKEFKVVGVELTNEDKESITNLIHNKMDNTMKWGCDCRIYKNGIHWSLDFFPIQNITKDIAEGTTLEVIMVSVCRYPGGVFTDTPKAYYIRKDGAIQQFTFEEWKTRMLTSYKDAPFTKEGGFEIQRSLANMSNEISIIKDTVISGNLASQTAKTNQTETTPQEESQKSTAKKRQVSLPETETTSSKPKILVSPIARSTDPETTCIQTETSKEETSTADDLHELQVRYLKSKLEKMEKEKRKLDLENEKLERQASHEQNQSMTFEQTREALRLIADQTEETSQEESLNGSKLNCSATKRPVLLPETETTSNKPKILVSPLARPTDHENTCRQNEPKKESKSTADDIQELQCVPKYFGDYRELLLIVKLEKLEKKKKKLEKLEKKKKKLDLEIGCLERRVSEEQNNLMTFEQFCGALGLTADKEALKRQMTLHQPKTTSSRKIDNVAPLERQTDTKKTVHQTKTTSVSQEQVFEM